VGKRTEGLVLRVQTLEGVFVGNMSLREIRTAQIGRCGELLVQYRLLLCGVESAPMTTDSGVDLVAYSPSNGEAVTIQVKTNLKPKRGGGKGKLALDWWLPVISPAKYVALVNLQDPPQIWLFSHAEMAALSQQQTKDTLHLYMYVDSAVKTKTGKLAHCAEFEKFEKFLLENRVGEVFGMPHLPDKH